MEPTKDVIYSLHSLTRKNKDLLSPLLQGAPSSCSPSQVSGDWAGISQSALTQGTGEEPEQSRSRRKEESPGRKCSSDADSRWVLKGASPSIWHHRLRSLI